MVYVFCRTVRFLLLKIIQLLKNFVTKRGRIQVCGIYIVAMTSLTMCIGFQF